MPERMLFEIEHDEDTRTVTVKTTLALADETEVYGDLAEADDGSFVAQQLAALQGVDGMTITPDSVQLRLTDVHDADLVADQAIRILKATFL